MCGRMTNSSGKMAAITRGMPLVMHLYRVSRPWPPAAWSARLASSLAWYSGVSGACCPRPDGLPCSHCVAIPRGRAHWPDQSGYLVSSNAAASVTANASAAATAIAPIALRQGSMMSSPEVSAAPCARTALIAARLHCPRHRAEEWRASHRRDRDARLRLLAPLGGLHQRRTALVVVVLDLAIPALKAFRHVDLAARLDRPHRARALAQMARIAAFRTALEKVDQVHPVEGRQHAAKRTQETAIGALGEQPDGQQRAGIEHIRPGAGELRGDRGLERLDLGSGARSVDPAQHQGEHRGSRDVLAHPQALLQRSRRVPLRHAEGARGLA